ncbi:hypothetical protein BH23CHL2_BH23CHL2_13830 [soil metagenome]
MRLNPFILLATLLIGVPGMIFTVRAFGTYEGAADAFTRVELQYVEGSFAWEDPDFEIGAARFRVVNNSKFDATVESFSISLRFAGQFAGSDYNRWESIVVPGGESVEIPAVFTVTANSIQERGGTANLQFSGQMVIRFEEFEQPLSFRFRGEIGQTTYVEAA